MKFNVLQILSRNGWKWLCYENEQISSTTDYTQYTCDILGNAYTSTIVAIISTNPSHLDLNGHYGILWLEALYECERNGCLSYDDMVDMQQAIIYAEENLLRIGMPFCPEYKFHGSDIESKKKRNEELRKEYNLEELENTDREQNKK